MLIFAGNYLRHPKRLFLKKRCFENRTPSPDRRENLPIYRKQGFSLAFLKREFGMIAGTAPKKNINSEKKATHISNQRRRYFGTWN